jgi:hypothetical protein
VAHGWTGARGRLVTLRLSDELFHELEREALDVNLSVGLLVRQVLEERGCGSGEAVADRLTPAKQE